MEGSVNPQDFNWFSDILNGRTNPNGCPITGTWY
jgi:hypothetical protein